MAASAVVFVGWDAPKAGREAEALESFTQFIGFLGEHQGKGTIESFEPVLLTPHGGDLGGFILVRGDHARLHELRRSEAFLDHVSRANYLVAGFGVVDGWTGDGVRSQMARYQKIIGKR